VGDRRENSSSFSAVRKSPGRDHKKIQSGERFYYLSLLFLSLKGIINTGK
jgi:hypothetical protein